MKIVETYDGKRTVKNETFKVKNSRRQENDNDKIYVSHSNLNRATHS